MKSLALTLLFAPAFSLLQAQVTCKTTPVFSPMANHSTQSCEEKEFDQLEIYQKDAAGKTATLKKQGHKMTIQYHFDGAWENRPSPLQIMQNYANALKKADGEVLYQTESTLYGKIKKNDGIYWIEALSDGSGSYWFYSIKEEQMRQDVTLTAAEIQSNLKTEGRVVFYGIYFDTDKAAVKPGSEAALTEIAKFLKDNPAVNVFVVGHTDNTGDFVHNQALSKDRATAVVAELVSHYAVNAKQVTAQGVASLSPVATNDTQDGKAKNRRVEIVKR